MANPGNSPPIAQRIVRNFGACSLSNEPRFKLLRLELLRFLEWAKESNVSSLSEDYPRLEEIRSLFNRFLQSRPVVNWTTRDYRLANNCIAIDLEEYLLLRRVDESTLVKLIEETYISISVQLYMLSCVKFVCRKRERLRIAQRFLVHDSREEVRDKALVILATEGWKGVEECAIRIWDSGSISSKIAVLRALAAVKSSKTGHYLNMALESNDGGLRLVAKAIPTIYDFLCLSSPLNADLRERMMSPSTDDGVEHAEENEVSDM